MGTGWRAASARSPAAATCPVTLADPAAQGKATVPKQEAALQCPAQCWKIASDRKMQTMQGKLPARSNARTQHESAPEQPLSCGEWLVLH